MKTCPVQHWLGEDVLRFTVSVVPAQHFAKQRCEPDVELIFLCSTHAVIFKSAFPLASVKLNHSHSWWREVVIPPRVSACCRWPPDLGLVRIYCHYLQSCQERGLNCVSLSLDFIVMVMNLFVETLNQSPVPVNS